MQEAGLGGGGSVFAWLWLCVYVCVYVWVSVGGVDKNRRCKSWAVLGTYVTPFPPPIQPTPPFYFSRSHTQKGKKMKNKYMYK